jgi:hypothetical protein
VGSARVFLAAEMFVCCNALWLVAPRRAKNHHLSHQLPVCPAPVPLRGRLSICLGRCVATFPSSDGGAASCVERNPCFHLISLLSTPLLWFFVIRLTSLSISSPVDSLNPKTWQAGINRKVNPTPSLPSSPLEPHRKRRNRQPVSVPSLWIFLSSYIAIGAAPSQFNGMTLEDIKTLMGAMKEPADMVLLLPSPTFPKCFMLPPPPEASDVSSSSSSSSPVSSPSFSSSSSYFPGALTLLSFAHLPPHTQKAPPATHYSDSYVAPSAFDSRTAWPSCPSIGHIRDQSTCGSCWAFGAVEAMSDRLCIATNGTTNVELSTEDMVSCCLISCGEMRTLILNAAAGCFPRVAMHFWRFLAASSHAMR